MSGKRGIVTAGLAVLAVLAVGGPAGAEIHVFPATDSHLTATIGQIFPNELGWFWSGTMGHEVWDTFQDALPEVGLAYLDLEVPQNTLTDMPVQWGLEINGSLVGQFAVEPGFTGLIHEEFRFTAVPAIEGRYTVVMQVMNDVALGTGGHTLGVGDPYAHQVRLVPEPATAALVLTVLPALVRRRRRHRA